MTETVQAPAAPAAFPSAERQRPAGVSILSVCAGLGGVLLVIAGLAAAIVGPTAIRDLAPIPLHYVGVASAAAVLAGVLMLVLAALSFAAAYGMFHGKPWAWTLTIALVFVGMLLGVFTLLKGGALGILVDGFLLWYLTRGGVERWFGKVGAWPTKPVDGFFGYFARK